MPPSWKRAGANIKHELRVTAAADFAVSLAGRAGADDDSTRGSFGQKFTEHARNLAAQEMLLERQQRASDRGTPSSAAETSFGALSHLRQCLSRMYH